MIDQQCVLNSRHKDTQTVQTWIWTKILMRAWSAAYSVMELHVNIMYHAAKKRGRGVAGARGGGGVVGDLRPTLDF